MILDQGLEVYKLWSINKIISNWAKNLHRMRIPKWYPMVEDASSKKKSNIARKLKANLLGGHKPLK